jgi:hypothetical protein
LRRGIVGWISLLWLTGINSTGHVIVLSLQSKPSASIWSDMHQVCNAYAIELRGGRQALKIKSNKGFQMIVDKLFT